MRVGRVTGTTHIFFLALQVFNKKVHLYMNLNDD